MFGRKPKDQQVSEPGDYPDPPKHKALFLLKRTFREFNDDGSTDQAAALTYYSVLALFPGLIAVLSLVGLFGQADESIDKIIEILAPLVSLDTLNENIKPRLEDLAASQGAGLGLV